MIQKLMVFVNLNFSFCVCVSAVRNYDLFYFNILQKNSEKNFFSNSLKRIINNLGKKEIHFNLTVNPDFWRDHWLSFQTRLHVHFLINFNRQRTVIVY